MRPTPHDFDPEIREALERARALISAGDVPAALSIYQEEWDRTRSRKDHFHASVIAHMAGVAETDAEKKHQWNVDALREADDAPEMMRDRGMYASLYNNLGMSHSLRGDRSEARRCFALALTHVDDIAPGPYADQVRGGIQRNIARLAESAP